MLHDHAMIIELNALVIEHHTIKVPMNATSDERSAVWHEFTERIQYVPGMGKMGSGRVTSRGSFQDTISGLKTHIYAPLGLEFQDNWEVTTNGPEKNELPGVGCELETNEVSHNGLYLCEDVDMTCNRMLTGFVRKTLEKTHSHLIERLIEKAGLLAQDKNADGGTP